MTIVKFYMILVMLTTSGQIKTGFVEYPNKEACEAMLPYAVMPQNYMGHLVDVDVSCTQVELDPRRGAKPS